VTDHPHARGLDGNGRGSHPGESREVSRKQDGCQDALARPQVVALIDKDGRSNAWVHEHGDRPEPGDHGGRAELGAETQEAELASACGQSLVQAAVGADRGRADDRKTQTEVQERCRRQEHHGVPAPSPTVKRRPRAGDDRRSAGEHLNGRTDRHRKSHRR
jgi:hypothetical protein